MVSIGLSLGEFYLKIGIYGFGSIGRLLAKVALERGHELIGVVDIDPKIAGKDAGELVGVGELGIEVSKDPEVLSDADVVLHATKSYLDEIYDQILTLIDMGLNTISTCETLAYPYYRYPVLARKINEKALANGVVVLGTGINPGFILDTLIITLSAPFDTVKSIRAIRSINAEKRRTPFKKKIGIGLKPEEFIDKLKKGELTGHVGYAESVLLIADAAEVHLSKVIENQEPVIAANDMKIGDYLIEKGTVIGIKGYGIGYIGDKEAIRIELHAFLGANDYEEIQIEGKNYTISWKSTGTPGDLGTASVVLSIAEKVYTYPTGLITMADIVSFKIHIKP